MAQVSYQVVDYFKVSPFNVEFFDYLEKTTSGYNLDRQKVYLNFIGTKFWHL